ncbi:peptide chain release factor 2 [Pseudodesulfovibrio senegalensis]|jgi:peptide chain release factor 2|uniref:Peptide chain release factor 2 n=2 Tax=Pseudodesulfovibrio senegalensis TaxID=1721087 RepID=A0A6N6N803_9BACT|nr:peptide chain release factor 2 [Pseudodesulfovibrio senegalensis]
MERLREIEHDLSQPGAWDKPDALTPVLREKSQLEAKLSMYDGLDSTRSDLEDWLLLSEEDKGSESLEALSEQVVLFEEKLQATELATLFADPMDKNPAILEIHPGAGGVDSQDWAEMLLRMYTRWAERKGFTLQQLDFQPGDEAGVKSVTLQIDGLYAFGQLRGEAGVHRLIRISPFDASGRRHTSFASVDVYPDITEEIEIDVRDEDLRIDVFRSSGPGGQHVNKTNSAVRITHLPTNIVAQCQNEKSQLRNKQTAMKILKARLYELEQKKLDESRKQDYASKDAIAWGSQIRTYTLQPYRLVKDHRSNLEVSSVDAVLDGDLDKLIRNHLLYVHGQQNG